MNSGFYSAVVYTSQTNENNNIQSNAQQETDSFWQLAHPFILCAQNRGCSDSSSGILFENKQQLSHYFWESNHQCNHPLPLKEVLPGERSLVDTYRNEKKKRV